MTSKRTSPEVREAPEADIGSLLFDYLVGTAEEQNRDRQTELLRRPQVNDELDFCGLLDGPVGRFLAREDSRDVNGKLAKQMGMLVP